MKLTEWTPDRALEVAFGQPATEDEKDDLGGGRQKYAQTSAEEWVRNAVAENAELRARVAELESAYDGMMTRANIVRAAHKLLERRDWYPMGQEAAYMDVLYPGWNIYRADGRWLIEHELALLINVERKEAGGDTVPMLTSSGSALTGRLDEEAGK